MTQATTKDYWISPSALHIELNAIGDPDYIQASCVSGAQILVYVKDIIGYDAGHNYRRWPLQAAPTVFNSHAEKYVYAAIPRSDDGTKNAFIVFPSEQLDIYGKNADEQQIGSEEYYYIFLQGIITSSGDNGTENRDWQQRVSTGLLASDEAISATGTESEWYKYSSVDGIVTFLKNLTMKVGTHFRELFAKSIKILSGGSFSFEGQTPIIGIADKKTAVTSEEKLVTPKYVDDHTLSKVHPDTAQGLLTFLDGIKIGANGLWGIDKDGAAKIANLFVKENLQVGGNAKMATVSLDRAHNPNSTEADRTIIGGQGFDLYMGEDGKSHLYVDYLSARVKAFFAQLEIRKISYSGGTTLFSNAGSTIAKVVAVYDAQQSGVIAYKCYAIADDGEQRTDNWWKVGMMALCQTFNIKNAENVSNRYYWRMVVGVGQETLEDGKLYDYVLLSNVDAFRGSDNIVPSYDTQLLSDENGNVLTMAGFAIGIMGKNGMTSVSSAMAEEGITKDDGGDAIESRTFYGYEEGSGIPLPGDVIVQAGDEIRWDSQGNVIKLATSTEDNGSDTAPSITMYHGIGKPHNGGVWQWKDVVSLQSPSGWLVNAERFKFFTEDMGSNTTLSSLVESVSENGKSVTSLKDAQGKMETEIKAIGATATSAQKGVDDVVGRVTTVEASLKGLSSNVGELSKKVDENGNQIGSLETQVTTVEQTASSISLKLDRQSVRGRNLLRRSFFFLTSNIYGVGKRQVTLQEGKTYSLSVNGRIDSVLLNGGGVLRAYVFNLSWSWSVYVDIDSTNNITAEKTAFSVPSTGEYYFMAYPYHESLPSHELPQEKGRFTINWAQLEEGDVCSPWSLHESDPAIEGNLLESIETGSWTKKGEVMAQALDTGSKKLPALHYDNTMAADVDVLALYDGFTPEGGNSYTLSFYVKGSGTMKSYLYPEAICYAENDLGQSSAGEDGVIEMMLSPAWTRVRITYSTAQLSGNLFNNAGFNAESDYLYGWTVTGNASVLKSSVDGWNAVKLVKQSLALNCGLTQVVGASVEARWYTLSFKMLVENGAEVVFSGLTLEEIDDSGNTVCVDGVNMVYQKFTPIALMASSEYEEHVISFKVTKATSSASIAIRTVGNTMYIAKPMLTPASRKSGFSTRETGNVRSLLPCRLSAGGEVWIGGVKLEPGGRMTDYTEEGVSIDALLATGIDIMNKTIVVTADKFKIRNNKGEDTFSVDEDGRVTMKNIDFGGMINKQGIDVSADNYSLLFSDVSLLDGSWAAVPKIGMMYGVYTIKGNLPHAPITLHLPSAYVDGDGNFSGDVYDVDGNLDKELLKKVRSLVGNTVIIYNNSEQDITVTGMSSYFVDVWVTAASKVKAAEKVVVKPSQGGTAGNVTEGLGTTVTGGSIQPNQRYAGRKRDDMEVTLKGGKNQFVSMECVCEVSTSGWENIYWLVNYGQGLDT